MIRALIFDFDGVIVDTELPSFQLWQEIYHEHGCSLPLSAWLSSIGAGTSVEHFDAYDYLEAQVGRPIDREAIRLKRWQRYAEVLPLQPLLPGIAGYIAEARRLGLRLALASSSPHDWVDGHLSRLGLASHFDCVKCGDDVHHAKPDPEVYRAVLEALGLRPAEAIAVEDSPNGVLAAKQAGIFCLAVPNVMTRALAFDGADLIVNSLADLPLPRLLSIADG